MLLIFTLGNTECDFSFLSDPCASDPDSRHCYQNLAVERSDPALCEKIEAPEAYKSSNPPKDKCYMMVAQSTGDPDHCKKMVGGEGSYEKNDCIMQVAVQEMSFDACNMLSGDLKKSCYESIGENVKPSDITSLQDKIKDLERQYLSDWNNKDLKKQIDELKKQQDLMYTNANPDVQREYFRTQREAVFEGIDDPELRSMIARDFSQYRSKHGDSSITDLVDAMNRIKDEKETLKRLDDEANKLIDDMKNNIIDYGSGKAKDAVDEISGAAWEWSFSKGSEEMKWQMSKLERMKDQYDKASAQYQAINEQIDKFKKVYDEVNEVYNKVNKFNQLMAEGKIEAGHAEVLKGAVYLGKGLEYATSYVPVFGSTMSTVSKETFDATVKFATKRAERTTALNKCIEDPENCDPDGITGY